MRPLGSTNGTEQQLSCGLFCVKLTPDLGSFRKLWLAGWILTAMCFCELSTASFYFIYTIFSINIAFVLTAFKAAHRAGTLTLFLLCLISNFKMALGLWGQKGHFAVHQMYLDATLILNKSSIRVSLPTCCVSKDRKLLYYKFQKKRKNHFFFFFFERLKSVCVCFSFSCWPLARRRFSSTVSVQWPTGLTYRKIKTHWKANYRLMILGCCELFQIHCRCVSKPLCIVLTIQFHQHL